MAAIVVPLIASNLGAGSFTLGVLGLAATAVDQLLLLPAVFGEDQDGPRIDDLPLPNSTEGGPLSFCVGKVRTNSNTIWLSDVIDPDDGTQRLFQHGLVALSSRRAISIDSLWGEGRPMYDRSTLVDFASDQVSIQNVANDFSYNTGGFTYAITLVAPSTDVDLRNLIPNSVVTIAGFTHPYNNTTDASYHITAIVLNTGLYDFNGSTFARVFIAHNSDGGVDPVPAVEASGPTISIFQANPIFETSDALGGFEFLLGSDTQLPYTVFEQFEATSSQPELPAYRAWTTVGIGGLEITRYGARFPGLDGIGVWDEFPLTLRKGLKVIMEEHGKLDPEFYDVTTYVPEDVNLRGVSVLGVQETKTLLRSVSLGYNLVVAPRDGRVTVLDRANLPRVAVAEADLGAHEPGNNRTDGVEFSASRSTVTPTQVEIEYQDPDLQYQTGSQMDPIDGADETVVAIEQVRLSNLVMTTQEAREAAFRLAQGTQANSIEASTFLPPSMLSRVNAADLLVFQYKTRDYEVLVESLVVGTGYLLGISGMVEDTDVYSQIPVIAEAPRGLQPLNPGAINAVVAASNSDSALASGPQNNSFGPPHTKVTILDSFGPLSDQDAGRAGVYVAVSTSNRSTARGMELLISVGAEEEYSAHATLAGDSKVGYVISHTDSDMKPGLIDRRTEVLVEMVQDHWQLYSTDESRMLNGANVAYWGGEIISWSKVQREAPHRWRFSNLMRGRRGTERFINAHQDDTFVLLDGAVPFLPLQFSLLGATIRAKAVPPGMPHHDFAETVHTVAAWHTLPFSPSGISQERDGSDNITVAWSRRTRLSHRALGSQPVPIDERQISYAIAVYAVDPEANPDAPFVDIFRTSEDDTSIVYTAVRQAQVSITPGDELWFRFFQSSELQKIEDIPAQGNLVFIPS